MHRKMNYFAESDDEENAAGDAEFGNVVDAMLAGVAPEPELPPAPGVCLVDPMWNFTFRQPSLPKPNRSRAERRTRQRKQQP